MGISKPSIEIPCDKDNTAAYVTYSSKFDVKIVLIIPRVMLTLRGILLAACLSQVVAFQHPFQADPTTHGSKFATYDSGLISPIEDLDELSPTEFTTLVHPAYPSHSVRIKQTSGFCDDTVRSVSSFTLLLPSLDLV